MHSTTHYQLEKKWRILIIISAIFLVALSFCLWAITWPAIKAYRLDQPLPEDWSWARVVAADLFFILSLAILWTRVLFDLLTSFSKEGVKTLWFFGPHFMRWDDVISVDEFRFGMKPMYIKICSINRCITINTLYYKNPEQLVSLIRQHIPPAATRH